MNPHLLTLALTTPLEQLLELPNAVRIAACARENLQRFSAEQLAQMLASMDAAITDTVTLAQIKHGGELVSRYEKRDLDWFIEVANQAEWPRLRSAPATDRDYLRLLALYKLGVVIEATADTPSGIIIRPAVDALMESLESLVLADLLPEPPSMEQLIEEAWKAGLTPEPVAADEVRKAQSQAVKRAVEHGTEPASVIRIIVRPQVSSPGFGSFGRFRGHSSELEQPRRAGFGAVYWLPVGTRSCGM